MNPGGVTWRPLAAVVGGVGVISTMLWWLVTRTGTLVPRPAWPAPVVIAAIGILVVVMAWPVRRYQRGEALRPLDPLRAARAVRLAQAAAMTGAGLLGWYGGLAIVAAMGLSLHANNSRMLAYGLLAALSAALIAVALTAQRWCRVKPPEDDDPPVGA